MPNSVFVERTSLDGDGLGRASMSIDHAGDLAFTAKRAGRALAGLGPCCGVEIRLLSHGRNPG